VTPRQSFGLTRRRDAAWMGNFPRPWWILRDVSPPICRHRSRIVPECIGSPGAPSGTARAVIVGMRITRGVVAAVLGALTMAPYSGQANEAGQSASLASLRIMTEAGEAHGTAVLIGREDRAADATLDFLTSGGLFRGQEGEREQPARTIQLRLDAERTVEVKRENVFLSRVGLVDLAVLRVTAVKDTTLRPTSVSYDPPPAGAVFIVSGMDDSGTHASIAEHARFQSTLLVVGDRDASGVKNCVGAPALSPQGVFGIVRECEPNRSPVISLLSMARPFLERHLPKQTTSPALTSQFDLVERQVTQTLPLIACDATGEIDVPLHLERREVLADATATLVNPREVHLTDLTVLKLEDRSVRLRFTLGGEPTPPAPPNDCLRGQALITLRLRLAVAPNP